MRELLILRHGKSDWDIPVGDYHRPLKSRGKQAAKHMGQWLKSRNLLPNYVLSSPAVRAKETTDRACKVMGLSKKQIHFDKRIYMADCETLQQVLQESPDNTSRIMLVGHNPGLEDLLLTLAKDTIVIPEDGKLLPTSAVAHLEINTTWENLRPNNALLISLTRPQQAVIE